MLDNDWQQLVAYLRALPAGKIEDARMLERLLASCWDALDGSGAEGMSERKLLGRMEDVRWEPPRVSFMIERHGATVLGSTRAALQSWSIDIDAKTADCHDRASHRQLIPRAKPLRVGPIAEEIFSVIMRGEDDPRLKWMDDRCRVRVNLSAAVGASVLASKQTVQGRARRLRDRLILLLAQASWKRLGTRGAVFVRPLLSGR